MLSVELMGWGGTEINYDLKHEKEIESFLERFECDEETSQLLPILKEMVSNDICTVQCKLTSEMMDSISNLIIDGKTEEFVINYENELRSNWEPIVEKSLEKEKIRINKRKNEKKSFINMIANLLNVTDLKPINTLLDEIFSWSAYDSKANNSVAIRCCVSKKSTHEEEITSESKELLIKLIVNKTSNDINENQAKIIVESIINGELNVNDKTLVCVQDVSYKNI